MVSTMSDIVNLRLIVVPTGYGTQMVTRAKSFLAMKQYHQNHLPRSTLTSGEYLDCFKSDLDQFNFFEIFDLKLSQ